MRTSRVLEIIGMVATAAALLAGCTSASGSGNAAAVSGGTPKAGGTLRYISYADVPTLDPAGITTQNGLYGPAPDALYGSLLRRNSQTGVVMPGIATSMTANPSATVWTLKLRPNVKFSDGTPYDAAAVQFNWQREQDPANHSPNALYVAQIASMTAQDATTLIIRLKAPNSAFDTIVAQDLTFIASPKALQAEGANFSEHPVGAGPFELQSWVRNSSMTLVKNPTFYEAPRPYLDKLVITVIPDPQQGLTALETGEADILFTEQAQTVNAATKAGYRGFVATNPGAPIIAFNAKQAPFNDPSVREAVSIGIDASQMQKVTGTVGVPAPAPFPSGSPYNFALTYHGYDPGKAQSLFDAYAAEHGGTVSFTLLSFENTRNEAEFIQAALDQYHHVQVQVSVASQDAAFTQILSGSYQAAEWGAPWLTPSDLALYLKTGAPLNVYGYSDSEVDQALHTALSTTDTAREDAAYKIVVEHLINDMPMFNYGTRLVGSMFQQSKVHGFDTFNDAYPIFENIWLS